jgi:hypothetical protein
LLKSSSPASDATGALTVRADAGFFNWALIGTLVRLEVAFSITVILNKSVKEAISAIAEGAWIDITYPDGGKAQVAETTYVTGGKRTKRKQRHVRLVVRRTRLIDPYQQRLWPDWRHHAFVTNVDLPTVEADRLHRRHATVELAIRDLKEGAGLEHCPSGRFFANAGWLACAVLAHNLVRWTAYLGDLHPADRLTVTSTGRPSSSGSASRRHIALQRPASSLEPSRSAGNGASACLGSCARSTASKLRHESRERQPGIRRRRPRSAEDNLVSADHPVFPLLGRRVEERRCGVPSPRSNGPASSAFGPCAGTYPAGGCSPDPDFGARVCPSEAARSRSRCSSTLL